MQFGDRSSFFSRNGGEGFEPAADKVRESCSAHAVFGASR